MENVIKNGYVDVSGGHKLYFEEWGNPEKPVIFYLHGGPGSSFSDKDKLIFNAKKHHVIFHDQRGSGRSTPYGSINNNTTQDLLEDINRIADHLAVDTFSLAGGSWGSSLSLLYAIANPKRVKKLFIWSIYLVRQFEMDYVNEGYAQYTFPEAWERFINLVPSTHRKNGQSIMEYYANKINSKDLKVSKLYADEWVLWELSLLSISYNPTQYEEIIANQDNIVSAKLETHYFLHKCFIPENYILDNIKNIQHIPCEIMQGRFDMCTPAIGAYHLYKAYGKKAKLHWTNAGHRKSDPENFKTIKSLLKKSL